MRPVNPMSIIPKYAKDSTYIDGPTPAQQEAGMIPLDTVPADWWNKLFQQLSEQVNNACNGMATAYNEILNVLSAANIQPDATQNDQLARAINNLRQTVANAANAGSVKSSATSGKVSVDVNGIMTPNGMGVPTALNTTTKEIVSAINELKSAYDQAIQSINSSISALSTGKAPNNHAAAETTYGVGNGTQYGHLKLSDSTTDATLDASKGFAATPAAVKAVRDIAVSSFTLPVGTVLPFAGPNVPTGYFLCDGSSYLRTAYPKLFAAIGTLYNLSTDSGNVFRVPDYRECALVGAGQNGIVPIATHDVYRLAVFKDDQLQDHFHNCYIPNQHGNPNSGGPIYTRQHDYHTCSQDTTTRNTSGRRGTTTRGKRYGVNFIIKY